MTLLIFDVTSQMSLGSESAYLAVGTGWGSNAGE